MKHNLTIIGFGGMGNWHYEKLTQECDCFNIRGIYDIRPEACDKGREKGLHVFESPEEIWNDPQTEIVLIATPNDVHAHYAIAAMKAGKAVICEKPVTMNAAELEEVMKVERQTGQLFSIHQNRRWDKDFVICREVLNSGVIGKPYFIESRVQGSRRSMHGWRGYAQNGGGMLLDWGVHIIDQALQMVDSPVVYATGDLQKVFCEEVEDNIKLFLRFENGVSFLAEMSTNCFLPMPRWHISCVEGTLRIDDWDGHGKIVTLREDGPMKWENDIVYTAAGPTRTMAPRPAHTTKELPVPELDSTSVDYYRNVAAALEGREPLRVTSQQALRTMRVIDVIRNAADGSNCHI